MKDLIPLLQTTIWAVIAVVLLVYFRPTIRVFREVLRRRLEEGASLKVGPVELGELRSEVKSVRSELDDLNRKVAKLFLTTMAPAMFQNLEKIYSGAFGPFTNSQGLKRELYHLRDIGYINVASISGIPGEGRNLSDYVTITDTGRLFVELRRSHDAEKKG